MANITWINKQGYGEFRWSSGNLYKGNYKNDLRNGYGEMYWTDKSIYKGNWVNGIQHGYGKMYFDDGTVNDGIFDHNIYQGPVNMQNSEIAEESYDGTQENRDTVGYEDDKFIEEEDPDDEYEHSVMIPSKKKSKRKLLEVNRKTQQKEFENTDEEIEDIMNKVKSIDKIDKDQKRFKSRKNKTRSTSKKSLLKSRKYKSRSKSRKRESIDYKSRNSSHKRNVIEISDDGSYDEDSDHEALNSKYSSSILPSVITKKGKRNRRGVNATVQPRFKTRKKSKKAIDPNKKMFLVNPLAVKNNLNTSMREPSVNRRKKSKSKINER